MIKDKLVFNNNAEVNTYQMEILKKHFADFFDSEGRFEFEKLKTLLEQSEVELTKEGYELKFLGKSYARLQTSLETKTVITPDLEHNSKPENINSENIYITGDNLDGLNHLLKSYSNQVKCIYIDPPYNTSNKDFVYPDCFEYTPESLSSATGIEIEEAERIINMKGKSTHSAWLTFMFPRLFLARDLLKDDGVIFISIDDNEQANLKLLCDEIFGEENFVAQIIVQSNKRGQTYKQLAKTHEYLLLYTKNVDTIINELEKEIGSFELADNISEFSIRELRNRNPKYGRFNRPNLYYPIYVNPSIQDKDGFHPVSLEKSDEYSIEVLPLNSQGEESCWRWGKPKFLNNIIKDNTLDCNLVGKIKTTGEYGVYEKYRKTTYKAKTIWFEEIFSDDILNEEGDVWSEKGVITEQGSKELGALGISHLFDFPKPSYLIQKALMLGTDKDSIVVDFFSGSATTADAIMQLNSLDLGSRKYILIQVPEDLDEKLKNDSESNKPKTQAVIDFLDERGKPHLLSEVGIERIKRAAKKIKEETEADIDYGFKIYNLNTPAQNTLDKVADFDTVSKIIAENILDQFEFNSVDSVETVLQTWKVEDGFGFTQKHENILLDSYTAYLCKNTLYMINEDINSKDIMILIEKIENGEINISRIIIFPYSFGYTQLEELKKNIRSLKNTSVKIIERY